MTESLPLCEAWFEFEQVDDDLFLVTEPHTGPLIQANIWLVLCSEGDLVIDTGNGLTPLQPFLKRQRPDPAKPLVAIATHAHMDHVGGLHEFDHRLMHRDEVATATAPNRLLFREEVWPGTVEQMDEAGFPVPPVGIQAVPRRDFDPRGFDPKGVSPTRVVGEGDTIDLGDRSFEVLHLPGHTRGSIGLWDAARRVLFSGDTVCRIEPLLDRTPTSDIPQYLDTMRRLRDLPVDIVHAGHDFSFGRDVLIERCDSYVGSRR